MSVNNPQLPSSEGPYPAPYSDDIIDLRAYLDVLIRWWREIVLCAVLGAVSAGTVAFLRENSSPPSYEASATAIMARVTSDVTLDERFQTLSEGSMQIDSTRRASLVGLVKSGTIADAVVAELGAELPEGLQSPTALLDHIDAQAVPSADARTPSDLIRITATAAEPEVAAAIANAWMSHYVEEANRLYGQVPVEVYDAVFDEQAQAEAAFAAAQTRLEEFIGQSRIASLTRQIAEQQALADFLKQSQIDANVAILARDVNLRRALFERLAAAEIDPSFALLDEQTRQNVQAIADLFAARTRTQRQLEQARALQNQVAEGGDAAAQSNAVALQLLKAQIYAAEPNVEPAPPSFAPDAPVAAPEVIVPPTPVPPPSTSMQWNIDGANITPTAAEQLDDVNALVASLESYLEQLDESIANTGEEVASGANYQFLERLQAGQFATVDELTEGGEDAAALPAAILASYNSLFDVGNLIQARAGGSALPAADELAATIEAIEQEIQQLAAALEAESARERQLLQQRDLAWNAYDTLSNKVVELNLERTATNREVRWGAPATVPLQPVPDQSPLLMAFVGGAVGLIFGVLVAFLMNYQGKQPFLRRRPAAA